MDKAFRVLREFVEGPGYIHVSPRTQRTGASIVAKALLRSVPSQRRDRQLPKPEHTVPRPRGRSSRPCLSDPDRVVTRLDSFISAYGARATLVRAVELATPRSFELLVLLFDRSEFLAELAIRTPDLVDELVISGRLRQRKTAEETLRDLRHGLSDEDQHLWLRRYHQAELMRIGLRDILGPGGLRAVPHRAFRLADACLQYALEVMLRQHSSRPRLRHHRPRQAGRRGN